MKASLCTLLLSIAAFASITAQNGVNLGPDTTMCEGQSLVLSAKSDGATYRWSNGSTESSITVRNTGRFAVSVTYNSELRTDTIEVKYKRLPRVNLGKDLSLCPGKTVKLNATTADVSYLWQNQSTEATFEAPGPGTYSVTVSNTCGTATDEIVIREEDCSCMIEMPSSLSPNGDGKDDMLVPTIACDLDKYELTILNRWGQELFKTTDPHKQWDGKSKGELLPDGAYMYLLKFNKKTGPQKTQTGQIYLMR